MPQDADASGLISLFWAAWIYWWIYQWLDFVSSLELHDKDRRERSRHGQAAHADAAPPSPCADVSGDLEAVVAEILRRDEASTLDDFLNHALATYEKVVAAFDSGDRETLRALVSPEVHDAFAGAIAAREAEGRTAETVFSQIGPPEIVGGRIGEAHMEVSIRFTGESFRLLRDAAGRIVGGRESPDRTVDIWTFERPLLPRGSAWRLAATEAGAASGEER